jgi:hypothetical protein
VWIRVAGYNQKSLSTEVIAGVQPLQQWLVDEPRADFAIFLPSWIINCCFGPPELLQLYKKKMCQIRNSKNITALTSHFYD